MIRIRILTFLIAITTLTGCISTGRVIHSDHKVSTLVSSQETWLREAGVLLQAEVEKKHNKPLGPWKVAIGKSHVKGQIGYCLTYRNHAEIFLSPELKDSEEILATFLHELAHVAAKYDEHGPKFERLVRKLGLEGDPSATYAGPECKKFLSYVIGQVGLYPI